MAFSYSAIWEDTLALLRAHGGLLAAIAGVFLFLPALLIAQFLPLPETTDPALFFQDLVDYYRRGLLWFALSGIVGMVGGAAMLRLVLVRGTSVGGAIAFGAALLPFYFLLSLISGLMFAVAFLLLIVPALYLIGRLCPAGPILVAESSRNPIDVIARSFEITKGRGWALFGLIFLVVIVGIIVTGVATMLTGSVFILLAGQEIGRLLSAIVDSALSAIFSTVLLVLYAAIYRALGQPPSAAAVFE
ncbi:MAG TPA: hypothetical protein VJS15_07055 [Allosphingosinicella sp.]|nr:hypothetical protein [Allosphingosinicella sp.]